MQQQIAELLGQILPRFLERSWGIRHQCLELRGVIRFHPFGRHFPGADRSLGDCFFGVNDKIGIEKTLGANSVTRGTCPEVAVEGKMFRSESRHREAGRGIRKIGGEFFLRPISRSRLESRGGDFSAAPAQGGFDGIREALAEIGAHDEAVHHRFDPMRLGFVESDALGIGQFENLAIDTQANESLAAGLVDHIAEFSGLARNQWREEQKFRFLGPMQDGVGDLLWRLPRHTLAGFGIMGNSHRRVEQPKVVVNLGGRGDGRSRIGGGVALLDGNRRGESLDVIHIGLLHLIEELSRVGREALDIFALSLGEKRVERQRGFARAAEAGHHHELVARNLDVEIAEIVLPGSFDSDDGGFFQGHGVVREFRMLQEVGD